MKTTDLEQAREIALKATQGEWEIGKMANQVMAAPSASADIPLAYADYPDNAAHIAHFDPPFVLSLLDRIKELEADSASRGGPLDV